MKISHILEAPIEDFQLVGNFSKGSSFRKEPDRRLLTNPRYVQRIKNMYANTGFDFRMWFVNSPEAGRHTEVGEVSEQWLQENMPKTLAEISQSGWFGQNAINILYTGNSGAEWRPMTGWIIAHRMAHAILGRGFKTGNYNNYRPIEQIDKEVDDQFKYVLELYGVRPQQRTNYYGRSTVTSDLSNDKMFLRLLSAIGTMRSARDNNIRTWYEFIYECFAQYLLKGDVVFNPAPANLILKYNYGRPQLSHSPGQVDLSEVNSALEYIADMMQNEYDRALNNSIGKIFVM